MHELTIVVCEIFNHPSLMAELAPAVYIALNNEFLALASESLVESGGCLAECDGEGVRVIFGTPLPSSDHAAEACRAALALSQKLDAFNQRVAAVLTPTGRQQSLADIATDLASAQVAMKDISSRQGQSQVMLQSLVDQTESISSDQVATELLALQTRLQASYQTTSMLSQLSLVKYLPVG